MKHIRRKLYYLLALLFSKLVLVTPYRLSLVIGGSLGAVAYHAASKARRTAEQNISRAFPDKPVDEVKAIALEMFENLGKNLFELFSFPKLGRKQIEALVTIENREAFDAGFKNGKGVLLASAHCGNWEILGAALSYSGVPMNCIARNIYIKQLNDMVVGFRESKNVKVILRSGRDAAKGILRSLRGNEAIGILIDQDVDVQGVYSMFFSRPAWTPSALATLAIKTGATVVMGLDARLPGDKHKVIITGPVEMRITADHDDDIVYNTQVLTGMIEKHIRNYPSQWVWMHERWKTQPQK